MTKQVNVRLDAETRALLDGLAARYGSKQEAIAVALRTLAQRGEAQQQPAPASPVNLPDAVRQAADELERYRKLERFLSPKVRSALNKR